MNIEVSRGLNIMRFEDLKIGDVFIPEEDVPYPVEEQRVLIKLDDTELKSAATLHDGRWYDFPPYENVVKVQAKLTVAY